MMRESPIVYLVDDDASILRSLTRLLKLEGFKVQAFSSPGDFLTKPFSDHAFLNAVREAINKDEASRERLEEREDSEKCLALLTAREREVFERVITGKLNKQIAVELGIVEKTVKVHR